MRKRRVRKVWALVNPILHAIEGARITPRDELDQLLMRELSALDAFTHGKATIQEWQDLAALNNLAQTLAKTGCGIEVMTDCHAAQEALVDSARRAEITGRFGLTGPGIQAVRNVIEWHDLQRSSIERSRYERAIALTAARVKSGHNVVEL